MTTTALRLVGRAIRVIGGSFMIALIASAASAQLVTLRVGTAAAPPGATVQVPVTMSGSAGVVGGAQLDILFETAVLSMPNPPCTASTGVPVTTSFPDSPPAPAGRDRIRLLVAEDTALGLVADGELARCSFQISSGAVLGTATTLAAERQMASDQEGTPVSSSAASGSVSVQCGACGC